MCSRQTKADKWSDRVGFVSLAGQIPKSTKTCMKSHKLAYMMPIIVSRWGFAPDPTGEVTALSQHPSQLGRINPVPDLSPSMSSASSFIFRDSCAHPKTIFWIRPCCLHQQPNYGWTVYFCLTKVKGGAEFAGPENDGPEKDQRLENGRPNHSSGKCLPYLTSGVGSVSQLTGTEVVSVRPSAQP